VNQNQDDSYEIYDLRVEVVATDKPMVCEHTVGEYFELKGEKLSIPPGQTFSIYALGTLLAILPVKQRMTHQNDWITTDEFFACPDPNCGARFRIIRGEKRIQRHSEVTKVPLPT